MNGRMKFLDLFAGVGGVRLGMEQAGHSCVGWVEWDKFARKSYQAIHDTTNEWTAIDINEVNATDIPRANIWCFGFPCQDISLAGKQKGITNGKQSSLFFTVTGLIRQLKEEDQPELLFIENVKNLLSINKGWDFAKLQIELDEIGYDCEWDVLNSKEVVPQNRERIFIIGHLRGKRTRKVFPIIRENGETNKTIKEVAKIYPNRHSSDANSVIDPSGISHTVTAHSYKDTPKIAIHETMPNGLRIRKLTPLECWRLQGFPDWAFTRAREAGLSDSQLYKQAGNSVTVPVIKAIADRMGYNDNRQKTGEIVKLEV